MPLKLHSRWIEREETSEENVPVLLLHGLFGSGSNLGALARHLKQQFSVCLLDLPSHGRSQWLPQATLPAMTEAVLAWLDAQQIHSFAVVGHSLGGKVAMNLALQAPERVSALVVADIAPVAYPHRHQQVFAALAAVVTERCESRDAAQAVMAEYLREADVIAFLLASLHKGEAGVMEWRFDREGLEQGYSHLIAAPQGRGQYTGPVLFIKGGDSDYIQESHRSQIQALYPRASLKILAGCGHWLHAQKPQLFNATVARFLEKTAKNKVTG